MLLKVTLDPITSSVLYIDNSNIDAERITEVARIPDSLLFFKFRYESIFALKLFYLEVPQIHCNDLNLF